MGARAIEFGGIHGGGREQSFRCASMSSMHVLRVHLHEGYSKRRSIHFRYMEYGCTCYSLIQSFQANQAFSSDPSVLALAAFFAFFLSSRRGLLMSSLSSASSNCFSLLTSSGLYHTGDWVISAGPAGRRAIVKWKAATKVPAGV